MATWREEIKVEGLVLAILGFAITRFVVAEALYSDAALPFLIAGLIPLVIGLGLTIGGVVLAIGPFRQRYVRTVSIWAFIGTGAMLVVIGLTTMAAILRTAPMTVTLGSNLLIANVLLGGAVGGAITGTRTAATRRQREEIHRQADRARLINRILRDEVLNATQVVKGYSELLRDQHDRTAVETIHTAADGIETTIENVGSLVEESSTELVPVDLTSIISEELESFPAETIQTSMPDTALVSGDHRLGILIRELAQTIAITNSGSEDSALHLEVSVNDRTVQFRVSSPSLEIPARDRELIENAELPEYDDPSSGFGFQTIRLLVEYYDGEIDIEEGRAVTITLPHVTASGDPIMPFGVERNKLVIVTVSALIAGIGMGTYLQYTAGLLPVIGALYSVPNQLVGWITHLFHSIVFGLLFAAGITQSRFREYEGFSGYLIAGIGWGAFLWLFAAGVIMPFWLRSIGAMAMLPNLTAPGFVSHVLWGAILGSIYGLWVQFRRTSQ